MVDPYRNISTRSTPQSAPIPGRSDMKPNNAGGYTFSVDRWGQFQRFLILGSVGGTYYVSEQKLTANNANVVIECVNEDGIRAVDMIVDVSVRGLAPKVQPQIFALAIACAATDNESRQYALDAIQKVCRTGTHLFTFLNYVKQFRGIGRGLRRKLGDWYMAPEVERVAYQVVKYRQREGWSHRDVLRIAHPHNDHSDDARSALFDYICGRGVPEGVEALNIVYGFEAIQKATNADDAASIIRNHSSLPWETVPTELLNDPKIWNALLDVNSLPLGALIRQLPRLTKIGVARSRRKELVERLTSESNLTRSRIHPMNVLVAMMTYQNGKGMRGSLVWTPEAPIVDALDQAFYLSFGNVEPMNNRVLISLDISGSMAWGDISGLPITPRVASAALSLVTAVSESNYDIGMFTQNYQLSTISARQRLDDVVGYVSRQRMGGTDCSQPMVWAEQNKNDYDTFIVYTDNETWAGRSHPAQALESYRQARGIDARLVVVGMTATDCSIADPKDPGMLDIAGFSTDTPSVISSFGRRDF